MVINTSFDFRDDTPPGGDPDTESPALKHCHKVLWSKTLPNGRPLNLEVQGKYLYHHSIEIGKLWLSGDSIIPTFTRWGFAKKHPEHCTQEENREFMAKAYTIGGMMVFPATKVGRKLTINGARGLNKKIADRFDLTLECIRLHYLGQSSPLGEDLARYAEFFQLFKDFRGYVEFFLLQDLVTHDFGSVNFLMSFDGFTSPPVPGDGETYREYRRRSIEFIHARNARIGRYAASGEW